MAAAKSASEGERLTCTTCGLVVVVDTACGCAEACDIICCDEQMKPVRPAKKAAPRAAAKKAPAKKAAARPAVKAKARR
jgi:hypothetical protein